MTAELKQGSRVKIATGDPTKYLKAGTSTVPPENATGTVAGTGTRRFGGTEIRFARVDWDDGGSGVYAANALVRVTIEFGYATGETREYTDSPYMVDFLELEIDPTDETLLNATIHTRYCISYN